jgi:glyoxylase-like metal-dependent hydrolase (beta-lactamase superfamily II)
VRRNSVKAHKILRILRNYYWGSYSIDILETPGHTANSISFLITVDGKKMAFTGDLIHSPGKVLNTYDLEWDHYRSLGAYATIESLNKLRMQKPDLLLPSHGDVMDNPGEAMEKLKNNLYDIIDLNTLFRSPQPRDWPPHVYYRSLGYFFVSKNGNGKALAYDGPFDPALFPRNTEEVLDELFRIANISTIDVAIPSHYHSDHLVAPTLFRKQYGARIWAFENMVDIVEHPERFPFPYCPFEGNPVDRVLRDGETFEWEGYTFTAYWFPGQTYYHMALYVEVEGEKLLLTGDTVLPVKKNIPHFESICGKFRNIVFGDYDYCAELIKRLDPDWLLSAHFGALRVNKQSVEKHLIEHAQRSHEAYEKIIAREPVQMGIDPYWIMLYPYRSTVHRGEQKEFEVRIKNYHKHSITCNVSITGPEQWHMNPEKQIIRLKPGAEGALKFTLTIPANQSPGRFPICADVHLDGTWLGETAEAIIEVE